MMFAASIRRLGLPVVGAGGSSGLQPRKRIVVQRSAGTSSNNEKVESLKPGDKQNGLRSAKETTALTSEPSKATQDGWHAENSSTTRSSNLNLESGKSARVQLRRRVDVDEPAGARITRRRLQAETSHHMHDDDPPEPSSAADAGRVIALSAAAVAAVAAAASAAGIDAHNPNREVAARSSALLSRLAKAKAKAKLRMRQQLLLRRKQASLENEKDLQELHLRLSEHYSYMQHFIRTRTEPTIFYLPAKHTPATEKLLEESKAVIEQKLSILPRTLGVEAIVDIDDIESDEQPKATPASGVQLTRKRAALLSARRDDA